MWRILVGWCGCALLLQGCGSPDSSAVQLRMWLVGSEGQARTVNELATAFAEDTGIRVHCEAVSWGEAHSKYLTAVAGGVEPDIGTMGLTWGLEFGRLGALVNLADAYPDELADLQRQTFPGLWESIEHKGEVYGVPLDLSLQILYYRHDLIPRPPETWEELTGLLERLGGEGRRMIFDWGSLSWIGYSPFLWQAGGDFYRADGSAAALDSPEAAHALEFFRDLYARHGVPKTAVPVEQGLRTGEFPLALSGNWKILSITNGAPEIAGRWSVAALPKGPTGRGTAFLGGRIMGVFTKSPHRDDAWRFLQYLFSPPVQVKLYEGGLKTQDAYLPPNTATWEVLPMDPAMRSVLKTQAQDAKGPPAIPGWTEATHRVETAIQRVILHEADVREELAEASEVMNQELLSRKPL